MIICKALGKTCVLSVDPPSFVFSFVFPCIQTTIPTNTFVMYIIEFYRKLDFPVLTNLFIFSSFEFFEENCRK